jgi:hypothetical protein
MDEVERTLPASHLVIDKTHNIAKHGTEESLLYQMYFAFPSRTGNVTSTTSLHVDEASAMNLCVHKIVGPTIEADENEVIAYWWCFNAADRDELTQFVSKQCSSVHGMEWGNYQLTLEDLGELAEQDILCSCIPQRLHDTITISAGAPHQVTSTDKGISVKVAYDFAPWWSMREQLNVSTWFINEKKRRPGGETWGQLFSAEHGLATACINKLEEPKKKQHHAE